MFPFLRLRPPVVPSFGAVAATVQKLNTCLETDFVSVITGGNVRVEFHITLRSHWIPVEDIAKPALDICPRTVSIFNNCVSHSVKSIYCENKGDDNVEIEHSSVLREHSNTL